jgi:hypothetical protein
MTFEEWEKWAERQKEWAERQERWADRQQERHEALAESLEILTHDVHELQARITALTILSKENLTSSADLRAAIYELAKVVESHERRIMRLEGGESPAS